LSQTHILGQLRAIQLFVEQDFAELSVDDLVQLRDAARETCIAMERAISRAWVRKYGRVPVEGRA
jgi:hypothetical protein